MQITLKLYATLGKYLPEGSEKNRINIDVSEDTTAYNIIDQYNIPKEMAHLVLLNGIYLQPEERDTSKFKEGDTLAIWPPIAGG